MIEIGVRKDHPVDQCSTHAGGFKASAQAAGIARIVHACPSVDQNALLSLHQQHIAGALIGVRNGGAPKVADIEPPNELAHRIRLTVLR
jgi:hypothetical protein